MEIKYYKDNDLKYANRKRYKTFSYSAFATETQKSVLLGDGAETSLKTKVSNICDYVTIGDTRWFVTSYIYLNGGQVELRLQRDVVGEFGTDGLYGKVERGYTETVLRNRKELSLNEVLKDRIFLKPNTNEYGNFKIESLKGAEYNAHDKEMWGVLYFTKPTGLDMSKDPPAPYDDVVNINIPSFTPPTKDYTLIDNGSKQLIYRPTYKAQISAYIRVEIVRNKTTMLPVSVKGVSFARWVNIDGSFYDTIRETVNPPSASSTTLVVFINMNVGAEYYQTIANNAVQSIFNDFNTVSLFTSYPVLTVTIPQTENYTDAIISYNSVYYKYTSTEDNYIKYGSTNRNYLNTFRNSVIGNFYLSGVNAVLITEIIDIRNISEVYTPNELTERLRVYSRSILTPTEAGQISISITEQLIDEPYSIMVAPLFDVKIKDLSNSVLYTIDKEIGFMIFNTVIQYLSGEAGYLVDAQVYPYCPSLVGVQTEVKTNNTESPFYPFFSISSNSYTHNCSVSLLPDIDIKKEYIKRNYRVVSPEQTGSYDFNFYDYCVGVELNPENSNDNRNFKTISIAIKTALKPFSIISAAVILPDIDSLRGIQYGADLRGSQSASNGFECSLATNRFQEYVRNNSNYQQIFGLQKKELAEQHRVERVNEITSGVVNTLTATTMGAIGGKAIGGNIGSGLGSAAAGATVGTAMAIQYNENEKLREFEKDLQQQNFDLQIGTIKALPNSINRISSFNEIILQSFWYVIEVYECTDEEKQIVNDFIELYGYGLGVWGAISNYIRNGWFIRSTLAKSTLHPNLHNIAATEFKGGIYYYD